MRKEKYCMLHCSATPEGRDYTEKQIRGWFTSRGWRNPGYRQITHLDGSVSVLQNYDSDGFISHEEVTNGARGWNLDTVHFAYVGGVEKNNYRKAKDTRTQYQKQSLIIQIWHQLLITPDIIFLGHRQVAAKACPSFDVPAWLREIGVPEKNIFEGQMLAPAYFLKEGEEFDLMLTEEEIKGTQR